MALSPFVEGSLSLVLQLSVGVAVRALTPLKRVETLELSSELSCDGSARFANSGIRFVCSGQGQVPAAADDA